jgi:thiosulfate/3-mercaptopyruvate sulfurtransferase
VPARLLVSVEELARELSDPTPPAVLDIRWRLGGPPGREEYDAGHIPSAAYVDLERDLADPVRDDRVGGRHPLPDPQRFGAAMRAAGVSPDRPVVVYDDAGGTSAARAWWLLVHHGHDHVRLLDGGLAAWRAAGHPLELGAAPASSRGLDPAGDPPPGSWTPLTPGRLPVVDAAGAAAVAERGALLDARAPERYRGEAEPIDPVAGHVPGARSAPGAAWVGAHGRLLPPAAIRRRLDALDVDPVEPIGAYCGSGVVASLTVLALASAGLEAALYPGSWSDWVSDPRRPVATGDRP